MLVQISHLHARNRFMLMLQDKLCTQAVTSQYNNTDSMSASQLHHLAVIDRMHKSTVPFTECD